jgi:hypothetical protein
VRISEAALAANRWPAALQSVTEVVGALSVGPLFLNKQTGDVEWMSLAGLNLDVKITSTIMVRETLTGQYSRPPPPRAGIGFSFSIVCPKLSFGAKSGIMVTFSSVGFAIL